MLTVIMLSAIKLIMLRVIMQSVILLNVSMQNVVAPTGTYTIKKFIIITAVQSACASSFYPSLKFMNKDGTHTREDSYSATLWVGS